MFISGAVAVLSQYISRLVRESRPRPHYFVEKELNSCSLFTKDTKKNIVRNAE
jgi:hypothetical protein